MSPIAQLSVDQLITALTRTPKDGHRKAGEGLLIEHDFWLRRSDFQDCVLYNPQDQTALIRWGTVRDFLDSSPQASTTELAILDFACALGEDRFKLTAMDQAHRTLITTAVTSALARY